MGFAIEIKRIMKLHEKQGSLSSYLLHHLEQGKGQFQVVPVKINYNLGNNIFVSDGAIWQGHWKITSNMFNHNLLWSTAEVILSKPHQITALFHENNNTAIDLQDIFFQMAFDTTAYVVFGCKMNSLLTMEKVHHHFAQAFDEM
eukprot:5837561-Ditylum_brightwellii.AAC.1